MLRPEWVDSKSGCRSRRDAARNGHRLHGDCCTAIRFHEHHGRQFDERHQTRIHPGGRLDGCHDVSSLRDAPGRRKPGLVSIFHVQRFSPASGAGSRNRNGYGSGESRLSGRGKGSVSAAVIVHTIGGYREANEGYAAAELRKSGFATLTYDSFAARETTGLRMSGSPGFLPAGVADAYAALQLLASEPRIDVNRIAIVGFSFGGEVAHLAAFESLRSALIPGPGRFAAHVAFYPAGNFGAIAEPNAYTGSPVLMLLGEKDDNLPVAKVESYLAYARAAGNPAPIETVTYPGAYHAWTVPRLVTLRFYPEYLSAKKCPLILLGPKRPAVLVDG